MRWLVVLIVGIQCAHGALPAEVQHQAAALQSILNQADEAYFNQSRSIMSNTAYDRLRADYQHLVDHYPELAPYAHAVGAPVSSAEKTPHTQRVRSLKKAYSNAEVIQFVEKTGAQYFLVEPKIDGCTLVLRYKNGLLERALTRGNGEAGSNVTAALLASGVAPLRLKGNAPPLLEVRGELCIPFAAFNALNVRREQDGNERLKSPRNTAAGSLRLKDFSEISKRGLKLYLFESPLSPAATRALGLPTIESRTVDAAQLLKAIEAQKKRDDSAAYPTDGVVIKVANRSLRKALGATAKFPHGALARKYKTIPKATILRKIEWKQSATGRRTPIAIFDPVAVEGATVSRASLYNTTHLEALQLTIGDTILITRAGGSVPEVIGKQR